MLDDSLLDTPEALTEADHRALLRGAAEAGARVRTAARYAAEAGVHDLQPDGRPRAILIAGPGAAATCVADLLGTPAGAACPVIRLTPTGVAPAAGALRWELPGWAGSVDLLLIATPDGSEPGLSLLAEQAYRRGCTVAAVAPADSPLTEAAGAAHGLFVPLATAPYEQDEGVPDAASAPGVLWALLTPSSHSSTASPCSPPRPRSSNGWPTGSTRSPNAAAPPSRPTATRRRPWPANSPTPSR